MGLMGLNLFVLILDVALRILGITALLLFINFMLKNKNRWIR